jgi:ribosomal protein L22
VLVLDKVIASRNVVFDENILYSSSAQEQLTGQSVADARNVIELIKEKEVRDARSILDNMNL